MALGKKERDELRLMFGGKCAYCGCELPVKGWHADHVEPVYRGRWRGVEGLLRYPERNRIGNFFPSCASCNLDKTVMSLEVWRKALSQRVDVCRRNDSAFRFAERFGLVIATGAPVVFWFEKYKSDAAV